MHVANVADLVPVAGKADARAFARRVSSYRAAGTTAMLGPSVEAAATLAAGVDRRTVRFDINVDATGTVTATSISRSSTGARAVALTYTGAAAALADPASALHPGVAAAQQLATVLLGRRRDAGALAIYDLVHGLATTEEGDLVALGTEQRTNTYMVVAEIMILTNSVGAVWAAERELPILYRNHHANPVAADTGVVAAEIIAALQDPARLRALRARLAVTIGRASYAPVVRGHHGLQLPLYTHLTSPLRRWPDLASQRIILAALDDAPPPYTAEQVTALAQDFNRRDTAARAATAAHLKAADHATTAQLAATTSDLTGLDQARWSKALNLLSPTPLPHRRWSLRSYEPAPRHLGIWWCCWPPHPAGRRCAPKYCTPPRRSPRSWVPRCCRRICNWPAGASVTPTHSPGHPTGRCSPPRSTTSTWPPCGAAVAVRKQPGKRHAGKCSTFWPGPTHPGIPAATPTCPHPHHPSHRRRPHRHCPHPPQPR